MNILPPILRCRVLFDQPHHKLPFFVDLRELKTSNKMEIKEPTPPGEKY